MAASMTRAEIEQFLDNQRTVIFITTKKDGAPVGHPLWFSRAGNNLYVNVRADSLKFKNVQRDSRVCCVVEDGETYFQLKGVMVQGRASRVLDPDEMEQVRAAQEARGKRIGTGMEEMPAWFSESRTQRLGRGDRAMLRISMDRVYSWDFAKVRDRYLKQAPQRERFQ